MSPSFSMSCWHFIQIISLCDAYFHLASSIAVSLFRLILRFVFLVFLQFALSIHLFYCCIAPFRLFCLLHAVQSSYPWPFFFALFLFDLPSIVALHLALIWMCSCAFIGTLNCFPIIALRTRTQQDVSRFKSFINRHLRGASTSSSTESYQKRFYCAFCW